MSATGADRTAPRWPLLAFATMAALAAASNASGCGGAQKRSYAEPNATDILAAIGSRANRVRSFRATSKMDYWVGSKRVRGEVWLMGRWGGFLVEWRAALVPARPICPVCSRSFPTVRR